MTRNDLTKTGKTINTIHCEEKAMKKILLPGIIFIISCLCIFSASALTLLEEPEIVYEARDGYYLNAATDGKHIIIVEEKWNENLSIYDEGYRSLGAVYLYSLNDKTLWEISDNVPPELYGTAKIVNDIVYWTSAPYKTIHENNREEYVSHVYQYNIHDKKSEKLNIGNFADTDGIHMAIVRGTQMHPQNIEILAYNILTDEFLQIPVSEHVGMGTVKISGNYIVWSENRPDGNGMIYLYNMTSKTMTTIGEKYEEYLTVLDFSGEVLSYIRNSHRRFDQGTNEIYSVNIRTNETFILENVPMRYTQEIGYPIFAWGVYTDPNQINRTTPIYATSLYDDSGQIFLDYDGRVMSVGNGVVVWITENKSSNREMLKSARIDIPVEYLSVSSSPKETSADFSSGAQILSVIILFALLCRVKFK